jgi:hypothetical protein
MDGGGEKVRVNVNLNVEGDWSSKPLVVIEGITAGIRGMDPPLERAVRLAREQGHTWAAIGKALGVSRQAAWERFSTD